MNTPTRLELLQEMLTKNPADPFLWFACAKEYEKRGDDATALHWYVKLTTEQPDYVGTWYHLGKLYERQEDWEQAAATYQRGMAMAQQAGDMHAYGELRGALEML